MRDDFLDALAEAQVTNLKLRPGDTVVVAPGRKLTEDQRTNIMTCLSHIAVKTKTTWLLDELGCKYEILREEGGRGCV